ncbi:MAG TPA: hypothetical protein PKH24_11250 [Sedimentisphaerales bacterium]|jgi:hypothetical protein|nr:hypothetical protein [Sedimentisphaerales bacterium]HNU31553.1 hypothetical protein [Sedimentisphaerales bacterium]
MTANARLHRCLLFAGDSGEAETVNTLAGTLPERGIHVTASVDANECLRLFVTRLWDFLIVDASGCEGRSKSAAGGGAE